MMAFELNFMREMGSFDSADSCHQAFIKEEEIDPLIHPVCTS